MGEGDRTQGAHRQADDEDPLVIGGQLVEVTTGVRQPILPAGVLQRLHGAAMSHETRSPHTQSGVFQRLSDRLHFVRTAGEAVQDERSAGAARRLSESVGGLGGHIVGVAQPLHRIYRASAMHRLLLILLLLLPTVALGVTDDEAARRTRQMADELKSPYCPGKSLLTCTSGQAYDLRSEIKEMMVEGMTNAEIVDTLELRFGNDITNPPQPWYTFFVPFLPFAAGILLVGWVLRRWLRREDEGAPEELATPSDEDLERLARLRAQVAQEE